jgi:hypothetical protein
MSTVGKRVSRGVAVLGVGLSGAMILATTEACSLDSPTYITAVPGSSPDGGAGTSSSNMTSTPAGSSSTTGGGGGSCGTNDFVKADLSQLTACGNNMGHCYDKTKVGSLADQMAACPTAGQACVPDEILEANGQKLTSCTSIIGPGACLALSLFPDGAKQAGSALKQDVCKAGQVCTPCVDPTHNNAPTPFCQPIGVHQNACTGGATGGAADGGAAAPAQACCTTNGKSHGTCLPSSSLPAGTSSQTIQDTCTGDNKCVPASLVNGTPVTCNAGLLGRGICMDNCFNSFLGIAGSIGFLSSEGCDTTENCVPCSFVKMQGGSTPVPGCT